MSGQGGGVAGKGMRQRAGERPREGGSLLSLNNSLSREIIGFSNIISHRTGCTGIRAGWEGGREGGVL